MSKWRNLNERKEEIKLREHFYRVRGYDDGLAGLPAASLERTYQLGYRRGRQARLERELGGEAS
jgi:hypothetical protein